MKISTGFFLVLLIAIGGHLMTLTKAASTTTTTNNINNNDDDNNNNNGCWNNNQQQRPAWHPVYSAGWTHGHCKYHISCNSPSYPTELSCCKSSYAGQVSGHCISNLPYPPTSSPTNTGGLDVWYPDYDTSWTRIITTISFEGMSVPTDPIARSNLVSSLESMLFDMLQSTSYSSGVGGGTLERVQIISIGGQPVRQRNLRGLSLPLTRELQSQSTITDVVFEVTVTTVCTGATCNGSNQEVQITTAVHDNVSTALSNMATVQSALRGNGDVNLSSVEVSSVVVDDNVEVTSVVTGSEGGDSSTESKTTSTLTTAATTSSSTTAAATLVRHLFFGVLQRLGSEIKSHFAHTHFYVISLIFHLYVKKTNSQALQHYPHLRVVQSQALLPRPQRQPRLQQRQPQARLPRQ